MNHAVGVVLVTSDGKVLIEHRHNNPNIWYPDHWCYPGGSAEEVESFED